MIALVVRGSADGLLGELRQLGLHSSERYSQTQWCAGQRHLREVLIASGVSSARLLPITGQASARFGESKMPPELRGSRLDLRPLAAADEELYCAIYTDTELMRLVAAPLSADAAQRAFAAARVANASWPGSRLAGWVAGEERDRRVDIGLLERSASVSVAIRVVGNGRDDPGRPESQSADAPTRPLLRYRTRTTRFRPCG
ncbi:MAG: hypothetical protein IPO66_20430 [Rhodanobacteraceae bacterium]|nr:hypothetical protein [Rhodanobacteraceae bacterium]